MLSRKQMIEWNLKFPFDFWWRKRYNIPFGSEAHRNMSLFDIRFEYWQEKWLKKLSQKPDSSLTLDDLNNYNNKPEGLLKSEAYLPEKDMPYNNEKEIEEDWENLDLSKFNDTVEEKIEE